MIMNRKKFLTLCQKVSTLERGTSGVIARKSPELAVLYQGIQFYPVAYKMAFVGGKQRNIAILQDMKANSIIECDLEKVEYNY